MKRIIGIVILFVGVVAFGVSMYIDKEVSAGKLQVASGERTINQVESLSSVTPETKLVGKVVTAPGRQQIAQGKSQIAWYESLSGWLKVAGGILVVVGLAMIVFLKK